MTTQVIANTSNNTSALPPEGRCTLLHQDDERHGALLLQRVAEGVATSAWKRRLRGVSTINTCRKVQRRKSQAPYHGARTRGTGHKLEQSRCPLTIRDHHFSAVRAMEHRHRMPNEAVESLHWRPSKARTQAWAPCSEVPAGAGMVSRWSIPNQMICVSFKEILEEV